MKSTNSVGFNTIILPTRPQPDTLVAIFLLKKFGEEVFPGISKAKVDFWQVLPGNENEQSLISKGIVVIDLGGGKFDHHNTSVKVTASRLIAEHLGIMDDPAIVKLLAYAERDDFYGKGCISEDPIDRAFSLSGLIAALNKSFISDPGYVIEAVMPLLDAHLSEENRRTKEIPEEFEAKSKAGLVQTLEVKQRGKKLSIVVIDSDNGSMSGYLRSLNGGKHDVVAQWLSSGHLNILTRPAKHVDLRALVAMMRIEEAAASGGELELTKQILTSPGRVNEIPEWYYDPATNSLQNGGINPKEIKPTKIPKEDLRRVLELGLSEKIWDII